MQGSGAGVGVTVSGGIQKISKQGKIVCPVLVSAVVKINRRRIGSRRRHVCSFK